MDRPIVTCGATSGIGARQRIELFHARYPWSFKKGSRGPAGSFFTGLLHAYGQPKSVSPPIRSSQGSAPTPHSTEPGASMPHVQVSVDTHDGVCAATLHTPSDVGAWPGVILYPDAGGVRGTFAAMADRLAGMGYSVLLPDVYYRTEWAPFDIATVFDDPSERERLAALSVSVDADMVVRDAGAFLAYLARHPAVAGTRVGTVGYCMGGRMSLTAAAHHADRIAAAASFHGGELAAAGDPDSPHLLAHLMRGTIYVAAAQDDKVFPADQHERLRSALSGAGVRYTLETYAAAHGFAVPDIPPHDADAERRHWDALARLYGENLSG
ncbi:dienelactone hydrolase family protein [Nonomuraea sp. NPDC050783]|uniref:dienelactone hydrolase family protein n=1 Tax=Nonomuraea sp. NPDC050783 TaxID=3154634 RepID=UPI00346519BB